MLLISLYYSIFGLPYLMVVVNKTPTRIATWEHGKSSTLT